MTAELIEFLRAQYDAEERLAREASRYDDEDAARGDCPGIRPNEIEALKILAEPYRDRPGFQESWL